MATSSTRSREVGVAADQFADAAHDEVIGAGLGVDPLGSGLAERGTDAVDEDDLSKGSGHSREGNCCYWRVTKCSWPHTA